VQPFRGDPGGYRGTGKPLTAAAGVGVEPEPAVLDSVTVRALTLT
jgi:hypothetical protein